MEELLEDVKKYKKKETAVTDDTSVRIFPTSRSKLLRKMQKLDLMSERDAYELISREYDTLLSDAFKHNTKEYKFLLKSPKFLNIMIQVVNEKQLSFEETIYCNSFIYNYIVYESTEVPDEYISKLLYMLGCVLNKNLVRQLVAYDLDENFAVFIAVSALSSFKPELNIKRLNFTLTTALPSIMTVEMLMNIYETLFDRLTDLAIVTIFDIDIKSNVDTIDWITPEVLTVDDRIMHTILLLLESMPPIEITKVLIAISEAFRWKNFEDGITKMSFKNIDKNIFNKISILVEQLEGDGYILP